MERGPCRPFLQITRSLSPAECILGRSSIPACRCHSRSISKRWTQVSAFSFSSIYVLLAVRIFDRPSGTVRCLEYGLNCPSSRWLDSGHVSTTRPILGRTANRQIHVVQVQYKVCAPHCVTITIEEWLRYVPHSTDISWLSALVSSLL
jgi:hypothetical protein